MSLKRGTGVPGPRFAMYSHDTCGLGHVRRNLMLASAVVEACPDATVLLLTGILEGTSFPRRHGIDLVSLPSLHKVENNVYRAKWLDVDIERLISIRSRIISSALETFEPDVFIVDNVPRGAMGELDDVLLQLRKKTCCKIVLGLRDILDHPNVVRRDWHALRNFDAIRALYDEILIYGDPNVFDATHAYGFPQDVLPTVHFTGYLSRHGDKISTRGGVEMSSERRLFLCTVGGGQDGYHLARAFSHVAYPPDAEAVLVAGPYMPEELYQDLIQGSRGRPELTTERFCKNLSELFGRADRVVSMGGYNTVIELLGLGHHPLIVPRVIPRQEQVIRAARFRKLGLVEFMRPEGISSGRIEKWLTSNRGRLGVKNGSIDLSGLKKAVGHLKRLTGVCAASAA